MPFPTATRKKCVVILVEPALVRWAASPSSILRFASVSQSCAAAGAAPLHPATWLDHSSLERQLLNAPFWRPYSMLAPYPFPEDPSFFFTMLFFSMGDLFLLVITCACRLHWPIRRGSWSSVNGGFIFVRHRWFVVGRGSRWPLGFGLHTYF